MVHHTPKLIADMSIAENFFLTSDGYYKGKMVRKKWIEQLTTEMLKDAGLKHMKATMKIRELTDVEKHYIEILKILTTRKSILVIEEITNDFRAYELLRLKELLNYVHGKGIDILYLTDRADHILDVADRIIMIREEGALENYTGENNRQFVRKVFHNFETLPDTPNTGKNSMMKLQYYAMEKTTTAYDLYENEIVGVYDQMWKFCPLLIDFFTGKKQNDRLSVTYYGKKVAIRNRTEALKKGIAMIEDFQGDRMFHSMSLIDNITILADESLVGPFRKHDKKLFVAKTILEKMNVLDLLDLIPAGGNMPYVGKDIQLMIEIARALCTMPRVIFFGGYDLGINNHANRDRFVEIIKLLRGEGITCVLLARHAEQLENICDRMINI